MSAAAARRRKQLAAKKGAGEEDAVAVKLSELLAASENDEATAYEALQLAQSQVRKLVKLGKLEQACNLAYDSSMTLLQNNKVSVASQLQMLLVQVLRETHTEATDAWMTKLTKLHETHVDSMEAASKEKLTEVEYNRLARLEREFLRRAVSWSNELGSCRFGHVALYKLLAQSNWNLPEGDEEEDRATVMAEAVTAMCLAEEPLLLVAWLETLPPPTQAQCKAGHTCPPADVDALLTRSLLAFCAVENLRDANVLLREFLAKVEKRDHDELTKSYMDKNDGKAPSHVVFGSMLLKICEKDVRTGPLYTWLLKSFRRELETISTKPQMIASYTTKIGKVYFNITPPPSMMSMMENMMGMMGGGGGAPAINPAMMQAMMQGGGGM